MNHFTAIKSQTVILKFIYVSFTTCIKTQSGPFKKLWNFYIYHTKSSAN